MSHIREFEITTMPYGDRRVTAVKLTCGKCGFSQCQPRGSTKTNVGPAEEAQRFENMFSREGWFIGRRAQEDRCPRCAEALGIDRKRPAQPKNPLMEAKLKEAIAAHETPKATPQPREMTREDGRIIFAKLEEVYRDEKHGYQNGWSDHKVAADAMSNYGKNRGKTLTTANEVLCTNLVMVATTGMHEHPETFDESCDCDLCRSYE